MNVHTPAPRSLFISHGVSMLAADPEWPSTSAFTARLAPLLPDPVRAIVVVSAHWALDQVGVTADAGILPLVDEGLVSSFFPHQGRYRGSGPVSDLVVGALAAEGLAAEQVTGRGLDHGALIPLQFLNPLGAIPVVQVSIESGFDPRRHVLMGRALGRLPRDVFVVASGGAVHNLGELVRFAPADTPPPTWAVAFDDEIAAAMSEPDARRADRLVSIATGPCFEQAHPCPDHYMPLLVAAGIGGVADLVHHSWQWSSLSLATYSLTR